MKTVFFSNSKLCLTVLSLLLAFNACAPKDSEFDGSRTANDEQFIIDFNILNAPMAHDLVLTEKDTVDVEIIIESGELDIYFSDPDFTPVYTANAASSGEFSLPISKSGIHKLEVIGTMARGYVSFIKR